MTKLFLATVAALFLATEAMAEDEKARQMTEAMTKDEKLREMFSNMFVPDRPILECGDVKVWKSQDGVMGSTVRGQRVANENP
jgi:hypothetical protein